MHRCICWTFSERGSWPLVAAASDDDTHNKIYIERPSDDDAARSHCVKSANYKRDSNE